jgi:lipid-A-disaccharide synthase-like uncharacterized protein
MKPGPIIAMLLILGLSMWIMVKTTPSAAPTPGAVQFDVVVSSHKAKVELIPTGSNGSTEPHYRFLDWTDVGSQTMTQQQFEATLLDRGSAGGRPWLLRIFNVSTPANLAWVALGLGGQLVFAGRMIIQWLASEKRRQSVVPPAFWYMSLGGGLCLTAYFLWRHDLVGVLGQAMGLVVYVRNIRLLMLHRPGVARVPAGVAASN